MGEPVDGPMAQGPVGRPASPVGPWRLPAGLRYAGMASAVLGILAAVGVVYLVTASEEQFFGRTVGGSEKAGYYLFAWVWAVAAGAQLFALIVNSTAKIWTATVFRVITGLVSALINPLFEWDPTLGLVPLLHLALGIAILIVIYQARNAEPADRTV